MVRTRADRARNTSKSPGKTTPKPPKRAPKRAKKAPKPRQRAPKRAKKTARKAPPKRPKATRAIRPARVKCERRMPLGPQPTDVYLERVTNGLKGTRFGRSIGHLVGLLSSKPKKQRGLGIYKEEIVVVLQKFVQNDAVFRYDIEPAGIVETWATALALAKGNTRARSANGETMYYINDYGQDNIARTIADTLFARYTYEDIRDDPGSSDVTHAMQDSAVSEKIIVDKVVSDGSEPVDILEVLRLFSVFDK